MENLTPLFSLQEMGTDQHMGPEQIGDDPLGVPEDIEQLRLDAVNVLEGRVDIKTFDTDYQERIKNYYRFSATRYASKYSIVVKRNPNTLEAL